MPQEQQVSDSALINTHALETKTGRRNLAHALRESHGKAIGLIHKDYPVLDNQLTTDALKRRYKRYQKRLHRSLKKAKRSNSPLIVFEATTGETRAMYPTRDSLLRLGIAPEKIFTIATIEKYADPLYMRFPDFVGMLKDKGLRRIKLIGTNLWIKPNKYARNITIVDFKDTENLKDTEGYGCVGGALDAFIEGGVKVSTGMATFPRRMLRLPGKKRFIAF